MNIKEIRIKKGLSQLEAARALGISRRTYQNLESDDVDQSSVKYQHYCHILESLADKSVTPMFKTNVVLGNDLNLFYDAVKHYKKRYCYEHLLDYINEDYRGKVCILYGLRRTGKTTLLFQLLGDIDINKAAYLKINESNNMGDLIKDINVLKNEGIKYIFIDEITLLEDFINASATLADIYSALGLKIILSGTDSLGFAFSDQDELFDRNIMIHTSYISFKEFSDVLSINDIDQYIEYGGTLKIENMGFDDPDYDKEEVAFKDDESTRKYIDTAISRNIQRSLKNNRFGTSFIHLKELYEAHELTNVINRIIENMNHDFLLNVILKKFKSSDLGSSKQLLLNNEDSEVQTALYDIDEEAVTSRLKEILDIKEKEQLQNVIDKRVLFQVKEYLYALDLIRDVEIKYDDGSGGTRVVFTQPGMRYAITKALVHSLIKDSFFNSLNQAKKDFITQKILSDVKGRMLEDIVLLDATLKANNNELVFKYQCLKGGEYDLVIYHYDNQSVDVYEVKHSDQISFYEQTKHLRNEEMATSIEAYFGPINNKTILYRGSDRLLNGIKYQNVESFLKANKL